MNNPVVRLVARAVIAGVTTSLLLWQNNAAGDAWKGAIVAGVLAGVEVLSPINPTVGVGKK